MSGGVSVDDVGAVMEALLRSGGKPVLLDDNERGTRQRVEADSAAAPDGLLPVFLVAGEAIWRSAMGEGFGLKIERDEGALLGYRVAEIGTRSFTAVMLSMMEAVFQVARVDGIVLQELDPIWREAMQRLEAEASAKAADGDLP